jgi:hypothetical protein
MPEGSIVIGMPFQEGVDPVGALFEGPPAPPEVGGEQAEGQDGGQHRFLLMCSYPLRAAAAAALPIGATQMIAGATVGGRRGR